MKVLSIGDGFAANHLPYHIVKDRFELSSKIISIFLDSYKPDVVVNCIGKTGRPNVDWCELNKEVTASANVGLPILLAEECAKKSIHLVHIGSGCIFFGDSPNKAADRSSPIIIGDPPMKDSGWKESDFANPQSYYSQTKYAADLAIGNMNNVSVLRIRMPISDRNNPRNLLNKLRGYDKVIDIPNSVTFMDDFARCVDWVIKGGQTGIFHVTNPEPLTAAKIMTEYKKYIPNHSFNIIDEKQLGELTLAKRSNCILDSSKLSNAGFYMTPASEALQRCMANYVKNI